MRGKSFVFLLIFLISISTIAAIDVSQLKSGIEEASTKVNSFFSQTERQDIIIITGSEISIEDELLFNMLKSQISDIQGLMILSDKQGILKQEINEKDLVLVGGKKTNIVTKELVKDESNSVVISPMVLVFYTSPEGKKIMVLYSQKELTNNDNKAAEKSFLSRIMDKKYVPAAATFLSLLLLYLWNIFGKTIMSIISDFSSSKIIQKATAKKKIKKKDIAAMPHLKLHEFIDKTEIIALFITTIVFAITMSWTWSGDFKEFTRMLVINLIIVGIVSLLRESIRQYMCFKQKLRTEYSFWPFGTILTFVSTCLGNTFSLVSYTLVDENVDAKKFGKISFNISLLTFVAAFIAYIANILNPSLVLQMIFVYAIMMLFIELFPMAPFTGNDIKKWSFSKWLIFYIIVTVCYVYVNFTAYV
jgi:hypothetical protein